MLYRQGTMKWSNFFYRTELILMKAIPDEHHSGMLWKQGIREWSNFFYRMEQILIQIMLDEHHSCGPLRVGIQRLQCRYWQRVRQRLTREMRMGRHLYPWQLKKGT